ncbi:MAG: hypothetical protein QM737_15080 [Ferruginibacter sp.]
MKTFLVLLVITYHSVSFSQQVINVDKSDININYSPSDMLHGHSMGNTHYVTVTSGSPYFSENWMVSDIYITDSMVARKVRVKLNLLNGSFLYMNNKNEELVSEQPVLKITMSDTLTKTNYSFLHFSGTAKNPGKSWYQVLAGKKFILLKKYNKKIVESKIYASSITEQDIRTTEDYLIGYSNNLIPLKKFSAIIELAGNNGNKIEQYISMNHLSVKKEADLISVINYYNSLN